MLRHRFLGPARPTSLVVLFHGLGGSLDEMQPVAQAWKAALPETGFLLLESPDRDYYERDLKSGAWSGDWYKLPKLRSAFGEDEAAYTRMVTECISDRCDHVSKELDRHLAAFGLSDGQLILAGFSQGAAVSAYTGLRRRCLGILPLGGPCPPRPALLPENDVTRVCAIVGDADHCVRHEEITRAFAKYPGARCDASAGVHVIPNQAHEISEASVSIGLKFLQACLAAAALNGAPNGAGG